MSIDWMQSAQSLREELIARRRDFHRHPELAFEEIRTAGIVAGELQNLGLEVQTGVGKTGVVGILEGSDSNGPTVLVRCDMDALPINEQNAAEYVSTSAGKMHACGHDGHTAIGLTVAKMLSQHKEKLHGRVKFVFQPAEEIAGGAKAMINDGALINPAPEVSLGLHLWNDLPVGQVSITEGSAMAGSGTFTITIKGRGAHGASPDQGRDPIVCGSQIVSALQTIVSRNVSALDTAVISVTQFHSGSAFNVIPSEATLNGTFRTYRPEVTQFVMKRMEEVARGIAAALDCSIDISIEELTPPLINNDESNRRVRDVFNKVGGDSLQLRNDVRTMGAEDMAVFLEKVPGTFFFVGSANAERNLNFPHHHPRFDIDEDSLPIGAGLLAAAVADYVIK
ncbi:MAG: amidohydrolase [Anaerolineae bacterium]|nr:amidohydrolase [Anaerolineae bacterium]